MQLTFGSCSIGFVVIVVSSRLVGAFEAASSGTRGGNGLLRSFSLTRSVVSIVDSSRPKRSISETDGKYPLALSLHIDNRTVLLKLRELPSDDFEIEDETGRVIKLPQHESFEVDGFVEGVLGSSVIGVYDTQIKSFQGKIVFSNEEVFYVEDSLRYRLGDMHTSIVYKKEDAMFPKASTRSKRSTSSHTFCGVEAAHLEQAVDSSFKEDDPVSSYFSQFRRRTKRADKQRVCGLFMQADPFLYKEFYGDYATQFKRGGSDGTQTVAEREKLIDEFVKRKIVDFFKTLVQNLNEIYGAHIFQSETRLYGPFRQIQFVIRRTKIFPVSMCANAHLQSNSRLKKLCQYNIDVTNFLHTNSQFNHSEYCLAYMFSARDFSDGILGLAWVAKPETSQAGGICEKNPVPYQMSSNHREYMNTGVVTIVNHGNRVAVPISSITFAHEVGHNFGAPHDDEARCIPNGPKGNYIMYQSATSGNKFNNDKFSVCSLNHISKLLDAVVYEKYGKKNCFRDSKHPYCGNQVVEKGEECDCGFKEQCTEQCCYYKPDAHSPTPSGKPCTRPYAKICSPSQGMCCMNSTCDFVKSQDNITCFYESDCKKRQTFSGRSAECPPAEFKIDNTPCGNGTKVCHSGECNKTVCSLIKDESGAPYEECQTRLLGDRSNRDVLCYLSCRRKNKPTCFNSFNLDDPGFPREFRVFLLSTEADVKYYQMANKTKARGPIVLEPGSSCDGFLGYCDVFNKCRKLNADGPLKRLSNHIFNEAIPTFFSWIRTHWYWGLLLFIGVVALMALFIKFCSAHTPSSNPKLPPPQRWSDTIRLRRHHQRQQQYRERSSAPGSNQQQPQRQTRQSSSANMAASSSAAPQQQQQASSSQQQPPIQPPAYTQTVALPPPSEPPSYSDIMQQNPTRGGPPHGRGKRKPRDAMEMR